MSNSSRQDREFFDCGEKVRASSRLDADAELY